MKKLFLAVALFSGTFNAFAQATITEKQIVDRAEEYLASIESLNADRWIANFAAEFSFDDVALQGAPPLKGKDELRGFFGGVSTLLSRGVMKLNEYKIYGSIIDVHWTFHVLGKDENGNPKKPWQWAVWVGTTVLELDAEAKVKRAHVFWDVAASMKALNRQTK